MQKNNSIVLPESNKQSRLRLLVLFGICLHLHPNASDSLRLSATVVCTLCCTWYCNSYQ